MPPKKRQGEMNTFVYDAVLWVLSILIDLFFREVHPRSSWKVPKTGPVIFVAAPHANQFVDPLILMRVLRREANRRVCWLIAEASLKRRFIGTASRAVGAVGVGRALDSKRPAKGKIYLPDPDNDPTLLRGVDTDFQGDDFMVGGLIVLPSVNNVAANTEIAEIISPEEIRLKKPFKGAVAMEQLTGRKAPDANGSVSGANGYSNQRKADYKGTDFKVAPKVDQSKVYDAVFSRLSKGECVGIFPEGGSHDRPELLPLKAGVAIMALGAMAADPDCGLKIVPCGMNYFHAHKFRSRAVVEFGTPIEVDLKLVEEYKSGSRRDAVGKLLQDVYDALVAVTVTSPDYETLMLIQAVRRLYNPKGKKLPLPLVVELNRRLVKGYNRYKDDPRITSLRGNVIKYNKELMALNVRDHQIQYAQLSTVEVLTKLLYRLSKLLLLSAAVLPGTVLFAPVFIAGKVISIKKAKEALANSSVKLQARDVITTWKLLVSMALAPTLYTIYTVILTWWTYHSRVAGLVPEGVPLWWIVVFAYTFFPAITFAALRFGEIGMDIVKSLRPLVLCLNPSSGNTLVKLRQRREALVSEVTNVINELGPEMFPDFEQKRLIQVEEDRPTTPSPSHSRSWSDVFSITSRDSSPEREISNTSAGIGGGSTISGHLPRNESFRNLSNIGLFASRPQTPSSGSRNNSQSRPGSSRGRWGSSGMGVKSFSTLDSKGALEDVSAKIKGAMHERGRRRTNDAVLLDDDDSSGASTPAANGVSGKKNS